MAELSTLARPYAEAVFELAKDSGNFDEWSNQLSILKALIQDRQIVAVFANPRVDKTTITNLLLDISEGHLNDVAKNLVKLLIENRRLPAVPQMAEQYEKLKAQHLGYTKVEIISTYEVQPAQHHDIENIMKKRLGKAVDIQITVDPSLLGGWIIRAGDDVIDLSIKGRLQHLANELRY